MATSARPVRTESQQAPDGALQAGAVSLLPATKRILEMIAAGASLTDILTDLCTAIDDQNPDMMSIVMLMDPDGQRMWPAAAPRMPGDFVQAISPLMIGENMASCGTAAFRKERVILPDVATDPLMSGRPSCASWYWLRAYEPSGPSRSFRRTTKSWARLGCFTAHPEGPPTASCG